MEEVFHLFNFDHPVDFTGRSMSVSDVVETDGKFYFCDSVGFREIAFDAEKAGKSAEDKIRVVLLEPGKTAKITEIGSRLEDLQAVVGGCIEAVYPFEENVCIVCNEEGKINGLPLNCAMRDDSGAVYDAIAGTAFLCDCSGERFSSLSEEQCRRYQRQLTSNEPVRTGSAC